MNVTPVVTPVSLLELMEWNAENAFREYASEAVGVMLTRRKGKKDIGEYLRKALDRRKEEMKNIKEERIYDSLGRVVAIKGRESTALEILMSETWLNPSFAVCHGLRGLLEVDIKNFNLTMSGVWRETSIYAYLQLGLADTMHILIAKHLGCTYFASFDTDFLRVKELLHEEAGITLLSSPEEMLDIL